MQNNYINMIISKVNILLKLQITSRYLHLMLSGLFARSEKNIDSCCGKLDGIMSL